VKSTDPNRLLWVGGSDENIPRGHPTLLLVPPGNGQSGDRVLPLPLDHYEVLRHGEWCTVMVIATGEVVFQGEGRAEVVVSRAPF
jgi:hypothetical protein